ncbi:MAG: DUF2378 family protein [Archangium sp.]
MNSVPGPVVFRSTVDALLKQVVRRQELMTDEELSAFGLARPRDLPIAEWGQLVRLVAGRLSPAAAEGQALEAAGREVVRGFSKELVGKGLLIVLRMLGPQRALLRMAENFRSADNFIKLTAHVRAANHVELIVFDTAGMPSFMVGILSEVLALIGTREHAVSVTAGSGTTMHYDITWAA